jgi:hypothetical protein
MSTAFWIVLALCAGTAFGFGLSALLAANGPNDEDDDPASDLPTSPDTPRLDYLIAQKFNVTHTGGMWAVLKSEDHQLVSIGLDLRGCIDSAERQQRG